MEIFKVMVKSKIKNFLPEEYRDADVSIQTISKMNRTCTGLFVKKQDTVCVPVVYLDEMFEEFQTGTEFDEVMKKISSLVEKGYKSLEDFKMTDIKEIRENIFRVVINENDNRALMGKGPNERIGDLAVIYRLDISGYSSAHITYELMEILGYDGPAELDAAADEYMMKNNPPEIKYLTEILGMEHEEALPDMLVISNKSGVYGAAVITDKKLMDSLYDKYGELVILPASIHEVLAVPKDGTDINEARHMVRTVNRTAVVPEDRLSDNIYSYTRDKGLSVIPEERKINRENHEMER